VLKELELGPNIARNAALSENVFMMVVCIELRIPLFVVGKPGSSKSLAKTVVVDNMQGDAARSELFKTFKQVIRLFFTFQSKERFPKFGKITLFPITSPFLVEYSASILFNVLSMLDVHSSTPVF